MRLHGELLQMPYQFLTGEINRMLLEPLLTKDEADIFDSDGDLDFAHNIPGLCRFRANLFKQKETWSAVFRSLSTNIPPAEKLGIPQAVMEMSSKKRGMILVTGPTGSGKSTTLAALVDLINRTRRENIITLEDPVEYIHNHNLSNVNQREIGSDTKSFAAAVKAALREDPDVILIGEMRDPETISTAITAAETGHLVLSTLHTIGAAATIDRIVDAFPHEQQDQIRAQLASTLECVVSQQLIQTADGKGRTCAFEVMLGNIAIKNLIRENKVNMITSQIQTCSKLGMVLMDDSIMKLYSMGKITKEKAIEFAVDKTIMANKLR
jgi:twitching motility protein PilT